MSLTTDLKKLLLENGATKVGFGDVTDYTPMKSLNNGIVFLITYPKDVIRRMDNAPTREYVKELMKLNEKLDSIGLKCEEYLSNLGYDAYAQTRERLGFDFGENNSFSLPHKTIATRAGLGWIGKSALLTTQDYGSCFRLSSVITDAPLEWGTPVTTSYCGDCTVCRDTCPGGAISGRNWNTSLYRDEFYDDKKCEQYALKVSFENLGKSDTVCGKCMYACPYTQRYVNSE